MVINYNTNQKINMKVAVALSTALAVTVSAFDKNIRT